MSKRSANHLVWISKAFFVAIVLALTGCASDIMKNYIGQPVELVILDYGPPTAVVDLGQGERAYQWRKISTNAVSGTSSGEVRHTKHGTVYEETETPGYIERAFIRSTPAPRAADGSSPIFVNRSWNANELPQLAGCP